MDAVKIRKSWENETGKGRSDKEEEYDKNVEKSL